MIIASVGTLAATLMLAGCSTYVDDSGGTGAGSGAYGTAAGGSDQAGGAGTTNAKAVGDVTGALIAATNPKLGPVVTDAKGWILYRFDKDTGSPSKSNCVGKCAELWPPMLVTTIPTLKGISATTVGSVVRPDGGLQLTLGGWPLYRYVGDKKPGQWKGQNVGGTWFVVSKTGKRNLAQASSTPVQAVAPPPVAAAGKKTPEPPVVSPSPDPAGGGY